jgi:hypothetical protein
MALVTVPLVSSAPSMADVAPGCIAAIHANDRATSYRAVLHGIGLGGANTTTEIEKPDRIHVIMGSTEIIAVGNKSWKRSGSGWQNYPPMPVAQILATSNTTFDKKLGSCVDGGMGSWHGQPAHIFKGTTMDGGKPAVTTIYVFSDGFVHHVESAGPRGSFSGDFSNFNSTNISAPS